MEICRTGTSRGSHPDSILVHFFHRWPDLFIARPVAVKRDWILGQHRAAGRQFIRAAGRVGEYADTAVGFFMLSTIVLIALYDSAPARNNLWFLVLAGAAAGFCASTKNEGQLFLLLFLFVRLSSALLRQGWRASAREASAIMAGLVPALIVLAYFKLAVTPENYYLLAGTHASGPMQNFLEPGTIHQKLVDVSRYRLIARTMANQIIHFGARNIGVTAFLAFYLIVVGVTKKSVVSVHTSVGLLVLMLAGYFAVYLTTPLNLAFQLQTSLSRLLLQLWPSAVFVLFMATSSAEVRPG